MSCIALLIAPSTTKNVVIICSKYSVMSWCMGATPIFRNDLLQEYAGRERVDHFVDFEKEKPPICYCLSYLLSNLSSSQIKIKFGLFVSEKILKIRKEWRWRLQLRSYSSNPSDNCDTNLAWHLPATIAVYGPFPRFK